MHFRATAARLVIAGAALVAFTVIAPGASPASASSPQLKATPTAVKPNGAVIVSGKIPAEAGQPYTVSQIYTNNHVARVQQNEPTGGVVKPDGTVKTTVTVPAGATRSDVLRPYGSWQYDVVMFNFGPGCSTGGIDCTSYGVNVNVLPIRTDEHIELTDAAGHPTRSPRTGDALYVHATNCVGGIATEFARVIDGNGGYFPFTGAQAGTTFDGSADLANGHRGRYGPTGPAHVSNPVGIRDSLAALPCMQSEGPASVATADNLEHLSMVIDITICPKTGACTVSNAVAPAGQAAVVKMPADASAANVVAPAAVPAQAITAEPTFVG